MPAITLLTTAVTLGAPPWLVDITAETGVDFVHDRGTTGAYYFPEIAGSGCALFDYDNDGDLDLYLVQARPLDGTAPTVRSGANRLYRNDGGARGLPRFTDVTSGAGVGDRGYGMGVATADIDNDGDVDLLVTNFGPDVLYRNNGDGTFTDVTATALPDEPLAAAWSTSAAFFDYDRDGWLDLYIARYVQYDPVENHPCHGRSGRRDYCGPSAFIPATDALYRNNGDGTFSVRTTPAGLNAACGSGLGVAAADFDGDGWPDVVVANDGNANQLWINHRDGTFVDRALLAGAAFNELGMPEAGMGVSAGDFDDDGDADILLTHLLGEHNTLLINDGTGLFEDRSTAFGMDGVSRHLTGFGVGWFDLEGDGDLDVFVANGAVKIEEAHGDLPDPYVNPNLLLLNQGPPAYAFEDASAAGGAAVTTPRVSRGAAFGDLDGDGDRDLVVTTSNGAVQVLRNDAGNHAAWLTLRILDRHGRDAIGARVTLQHDGITRHRHVHTDGSYLSASAPTVEFAVQRSAEQSVTVQWVGGACERFAGLRSGTPHVLREGRGTAAAVAAEFPTRERQPPRAAVVAPPWGAAPPPDLGALEPAVATQLQSARSAVDHAPQSAAAQGRLGMLYHAYDLRLAARPHYERAAALDPADPQWPYYLGLLALDAGDHSAAATAFDGVLRLDPQHVPAALRRATVAVRLGDLAGGERLAVAVLNGAPPAAERAVAECTLGQIAAASGRHDQAVAHFDRALAAEPRYGWARYRRAHSLRALGRVAEAEAEFSHAAEQRDAEPHIADPLRAALLEVAAGGIQALHDGLSALRSGDGQVALALLQQAVATHPDLAEAHGALGAAWLRAGDFDRAEPALRRAVALEPHYVDALYNLGLLSFRRGDDDAAATAFRRALAVRPAHFDSLLGLGRIHLRGAEPAQAVPLFEAAALTQPQDARSYKLLARAHVALRQPGAACAALERGRRARPQDASLTDRLAWILATSGDPTVRDAERALRLAESVCAITARREPRALDTLAVAFAANARFDDALATAGEAATAADAAGDRALAAAIRGRMDLYRRQEAHVDP